MLRQGKRARYQANYQRWRVQGGTELKGGNGSGGGGVVEELELDTEKRNR